MMGYNGGWDGMGGMGVWGGLTALVILIDLVLVGVWLWQQITKK